MQGKVIRRINRRMRAQRRQDIANDVAAKLLGVDDPYYRDRWNQMQHAPEYWKLLKFAEYGDSW